MIAEGILENICPILSGECGVDTEYLLRDNASVMAKIQY